MLLSGLVILCMSCACAFREVTDHPSCDRTYKDHRSYYKKGDIILGAIVHLHILNIGFPRGFTRICSPWQCLFPSWRYLRHYMALVYATEEINRNPNLLPNHTLGYWIFDSCSSEMKGLHSALSLLSGTTDSSPNYQCERKGRLAAVIGDLSSTTSLSIAQLLGIYRYPQISYGALNPLFSDKISYPSFYRTVPNEISQYQGIVQLLKYFGWTWVGLVTSDDESGERARLELEKQITQSGACVEFMEVLPNAIAVDRNKMRLLIEVIARSTAHVIILYGTTTSTAQQFMSSYWVYSPKKIWISSATMPFLAEYGYENMLNTLNGTLAFSIKKGPIPGFSDFLHSVNPSNSPDDAALRKIWQMTFDCRSEENELLYYKSYLPLCTGNETTQSLHTSVFDVHTFRLSYSVYTAVYVLAHALHDMYTANSKAGASGTGESVEQEAEPWQLNRFLRKIQFKTSAGDEIYFDDNGDFPAQYDILNWILFPNGTMRSFQVGSFNPSAPPGQQLLINQSSILWPHPYSNQNQIPRSDCSDRCPPGYRKALSEGKPICCFSCLPCAEGEFSNSTDMENCLKCPEDQWPNEWKDGCIQKTTVFLSYDEPLGMSLVSVAIGFSVTTAAVLGLFLRHRDTPLVKANNRDLSYTLLISLMMAFLCSLLFIGRPSTFSCLIQQAIFGIIFTIAVSCVLAKTITVVIAFNATKPGSVLNRWLGPKVSGSLVLCWSLGEAVICVSWLITAPPHPYTDYYSETGNMILQCDQGSTTAFYSVIGYMGLLAFASFIVAFLARNLPDRFNEAQLITFSMLVFCSVWVSFIPAYLSTKGRYMVAVEIFAILASSAGLLGCIFIPKCYIILFRPGMNTNERNSVRNKS